MKIILLILLIFIPAFLNIASAKKNDLLDNFSIESVQIEKAILPAWIVWVAIGASFAVGVYTFYQMRKMQKQNKQNKPEPSQIDGSIADYGVKTSGVFGTVWMNANHIDVFNQGTTEIRQNVGGGKK